MSSTFFLAFSAVLCYVLYLFFVWRSMRMAWQAAAGAGLGALAGLFGRGQPRNSTTTSTTSLPDYLQGPVSNLLGRANDTFHKPYEAFTGERTAGASGGTGAGAYDFSQGIAGLRGLTAPSQEGRGAINNVLGGGINTYQGPGNRISADLVGQGQKYQNPYLDQVLDRSQDRIMTAADERARGIGTQYRNLGGYGGTAATHALSSLNTSALDDLADVSAQAYSRSFEQGMNRAGQDRQASIQGEQLRGEAGRQNIAGASTLGQLGVMSDNLGTQALANQQGIAQSQLQGEGMLRNIAQNRADTNYDTYMDRREFDVNRQSQLAQLLATVPSGRTMTQQTKTPREDPLSALFGGALTGGSLGMSLVA